MSAIPSIGWNACAMTGRKPVIRCVRGRRLQICATNKLPIPEWVTDYLAGAADRMLSAETAESKDARAVLPKILGFPSKRGPGNPLRLENDEVGVDRWLFSRRFAAAIGGGRSIQDALAVAVLLLDPADHDRDELTLLRWVAKEFGLPTHPRTENTWIKALRGFAAASGFREIRIVHASALN